MSGITIKRISPQYMQVLSHNLKHFRRLQLQTQGQQQTFPAMADNIVAKCNSEKKLNTLLGAAQIQKWMATVTEFIVKMILGFSAQLLICRCSRPSRLHSD